MKRIIHELLLAFQFMTRIPISGIPHVPGAFARAARFFPFVGLLLGLIAAGLDRLLAPYLRPQVLALILITYMVLITGALHEDGLADSADGFGGARPKEKILSIMRDSRIGTYGAVAVTLSLLSRFVLISNTSQARLPGFLIAASVLSRWTSLPLSFYLPYAREEKGLGASMAGKLPISSMAWGTVFSLASVGIALYQSALAAWLITLVITGGSGLYFKRHIQGVTGDCLGATNQLTEVAIYFYAAVLR